MNFDGFLAILVLKKPIKQARAKPEADATLFTACCILLMSTVDVES